MEIKPCKLCPEKRYGSSSWCRTHHFAREKEKREAKALKVAARKLKKKEKKDNNPRKLKKALDTVFSLYIRKRVSDAMGSAKCVSCGRIEAYTALQNGHYISRSHFSTRWDIRNCHPQCVGCNVFKGGNYPAYTKYLLENYGADWLTALIADGEKYKKWTAEELKAEIEKYKELIKNL